MLYRNWLKKTTLAVIFDQSSDNLTILYASPKYDKSDEILKNMGYSTSNSQHSNNKKPNFHH